MNYCVLRTYLRSLSRDDLAQASLTCPLCSTALLSYSGCLCVLPLSMRSFCFPRILQSPASIVVVIIIMGWV